jgi:hypothetical protein
MARKRRARSARGKGRRRSREKASGLERARGRAHDGDEVDDGATILQLASGLRSRSASQGKRAKAAATGAVCGREERWFGRTAEADAELAVGEWVGAGERPRARRRRGRRRGRDSSTRSWARDAEGVAVREGVDSRHGGGLRARGALAQACGEKPTPGSQMPSGRRGREAARPTATRSAAEPRFRRLAFGLGAEEGTVREGEDSYHRGSARARGAIGRAYGGSRRRAHR